MKNKKILSKKVAKKLICILLLLAVSLLSIFVVSNYATAPETYKSTIKSIDEKKATVMGITAAAATASTALALIPDDTTTPIANKIMEISSYLLIVVCVMVLEKSLLTVFGFISCNFLIPFACALLGIYTFFKKETLKNIAIKFIVFAILLVLIIPISFEFGDLIYDTNKASIEQILDENNSTEITEESTEKTSWWKNPLKIVKEFTADIMEKAKQTLNGFIDTVATFIIAYCAVPVLVVFFMLWLFKVLFGITVHIPKPEGIKPFKNKKDCNELTKT